MSRSMMVVRRADLRDVDWIERPLEPVGEGQVSMRIDRFALTSNNITYAAFGVAMRYWDFFPTGDPATGCIPVWGFAVVVESRCDGIEPGERFYGYWPIADERCCSNRCVSRRPGSVDGAAASARTASGLQPLPALPVPIRLTMPALEAEQALLRPLFTTSFLIDDFLASEQFFGASVVLMSSASSKTAYGAAFCLARRRGNGERRIDRRPHLTAQPGVHARSLGCYDTVVGYDELGDVIGTANGGVRRFQRPCQRCVRPFIDNSAISWSTAARSVVHIGRNWAAAKTCPARGRCCSSHRPGSSNGSPTGARPTCRRGSQLPGRHS